MGDINSTHRESKLDSNSINSESIIQSSNQNNLVVIKPAHFLSCRCRYLVDRVVDTAVVVLFKKCIGKKVTYQSICRLYFHSLRRDTYTHTHTHTHTHTLTHTHTHTHTHTNTFSLYNLLNLPKFDQKNKDNVPLEYFK